ncbi:MAG TPA: branched-chain amino acid transaminase [Blastocatellia bacterium]|nr:branched-chain amino acid transaminase [Blastocatellia bacterium]
MATERARKIWHNGNLIEWDEAKIHVMSHVINYASSIFEGIRCYATPQGPAIFRLREHIERLHDSCHIYRMDTPYSVDDLVAACEEVVRVNEFRECYLRPIVFRGYGSFGVNPLPLPIEVFISSWVWERYLGADSVEQGVDVCVASWARMHPNTLPATAKAGANYLNSQLVKMEALTNGFSEGIALDTSGMVSEGSSENIFLVRDGALHTPPLGSAILPGITRDSIIQIARSLGYEIREGQIPRAALYIAEEVFFTGTAAEVTPVRSIDRIKIGNGECGPVTREIQKAYFEVVTGHREAPGNWLTFVK